MIDTMTDTPMPRETAADLAIGEAKLAHEETHVLMADLEAQRARWEEKRQYLDAMRRECMDNFAEAIAHLEARIGAFDRALGSLSEMAPATPKMPVDPAYEAPVRRG